MKRRFILVALAVILLTVGTVLAVMWFRSQSQKNQPPSTPITSNTPAPQTPPAPAPLSPIDQKLKDMSLRDKVASLFIFHTPTTDPTALATYITAHKPSGLLFMGDNIPQTLPQLQAETSALVADKKFPPLLAVDEEGDTVKRLASDTFPGALTLPDLPPAATKDAFAKRSDLLKSVGLNLNFGIIADVTADPHSFIYPRVLGTTPQAASERVAQAVAGAKGKTLSTLKHFPGHGETPANSHTSVPTATTTYDDWRSRVAQPFKAGINAGAEVVMFGHLRYSSVDTQPATLSKKWHDIIRNELGFKGLTITDDMIMLLDSGEAAYKDPVSNAIAAIEAGNDLLLYVLNHDSATSNIDPNKLIDGVVAAIQDGRIADSAIDARVKNVLTMRSDLGKMLYGQ